MKKITTTDGKELQQALQSLETCCPGSTCGSNQQASSSALHEALLNLERARDKEQRLKEESDALLEGMNIIISSKDTRKAFSRVLEVLKRLLGFDSAFVLHEQGHGSLSIIASSSPKYENCTWHSGEMFKQILSGESINIGDINKSIDWLAQSQAIRQNVTSAFHTPFSTCSERAMLVCTSSKDNFFDDARVNLLGRFLPLAAQALHNLELNDCLRNEISEKNKAEIALRNAHNDLEIRVKERTADLETSNLMLQHEIKERKWAEKEKEKLFAQLLQSQKMESLGLLAGGIAHDFNNILTTILGYSELGIIHLPEDAPLKHDFQVIYDAGQQAASLTRQLLAFSRKHKMEIELIDLNYHINTMADMLSRLIGKNILLNFSLDKEIGKIKANPNQIEQILMNLAVNAKDAMPQGGSLTIETKTVHLDSRNSAGHSDMASGRCVLMSVRDTGEGMSKEIQKDIFKPFFTTKDQDKGTGLGLATVIGIVKQHNGHIEVESKPGQGTMFSIYFPVHQ